MGPVAGDPGQPPSFVLVTRTMSLVLTMLHFLGIAIVLLIVICQNLSGSAIAGGYYGQILNLVGVCASQILATTLLTVKADHGKHPADRY